MSDPGNAEARWQRVYGLLLQGRYREAWPQFSWRWRVAGFPSPRLPTLQPAWDGVIPCSRLLLWREQGIGDELMFLGLMGEARRWLAERRVEPVLLVDGRLVAPLRRSWPDLTIEAWGTPLQALDCDQHLPIGELCGLLAPAAAGPPRIGEPWLQADPSRLAELHARLPRPGQLRCGIAWRSAAAVLGACKSLPLASLARALQLEGVQLVNLQYGTRAGELAELAQRSGLRVEEVPGLDLHDDLDGLAALIAGCDLVVTASNCTAHLSSAVGTPTWVLLHRVPHWPWGLEDHTTPWHPGARLFRQTRSGDWEFPLKQVNRALQQRLQNSA